MIRALFLPDAWFAQNIISIEINRTQVLVCEATHKNGITKIEKITTVSIDTNNELDHEEQTLVALNQALSHIKKSSDSHVLITLPNNQIFFKEITVPFLDHQKIKMILGYEIESLLPFSLNEAVLDFIITKQDIVKKESTLVVAIAQKKQLDFYLDLIKQTKLTINTITTDLVSIFSLYSLIYASNKSQYQILIELGKNSITISYLWHGQLWMIRNLPYGLNSIVSKIASNTKKPTKDIIENLFRFGLELNESYAPKEYFTKLFSDLIFTINSFRQQINFDQDSCKILVIETGFEIKNITQELSEKIKINCELFELSKLNSCKSIIIEPGVTISNSNLTCLSSALITKENSDFNLLPQDLISNKLERYQLITIMALTLSLFLAIYGLGYFKNKSLAATLAKYQKSTISALKDKFTIDSNSLTEVLAQASNNVSRERKLWFSFSNQTRYSTLKYLQVLSNAIDMKKINLDIQKLIINDHNMTIKGSAQEYEDLYAFERALVDIPIFKSVTKPQERNFTINITLRQSDRDVA